LICSKGTPSHRNPDGQAMGGRILLQLSIGIAGGCAIALLSYRLKFLGRGGAIAQGILGTILLGVGGWSWTVPMVVFFLVASALSQFAERARIGPGADGRGSRRDAVQVVANGGIAGLLVVLGAVLHDPRLYLVFLGAVAAAASDTLATEVGTLVGGRPRLITTLQPVPRGTSGGVTIAGTLAAAGGAAIVAASGLPWIPTGLHEIVPPLAGGFAGSLVDSVLGATVQGRFRCRVCGKSTEQRIHCGQQCIHTGGLRSLTNDGVNVLCTAAGAACAALLACT
jgi:uncharacterized protein (TIGR00297 family)